MQALLGRGGRDDLDIRLFKCFGDEMAYGTIVVDDKDSRHRTSLLTKSSSTVALQRQPLHFQQPPHLHASGTFTSLVSAERQILRNRCLRALIQQYSASF